MNLITQEQNQYETDMLESKFEELKTKAIEEGFNNLEKSLMHFMFYNKANHGLTARTFSNYIPRIILQNTNGAELTTISKIKETYKTIINREKNAVKEIANIAGINEKKYNLIYNFVTANETTL